MVSRHLVNSPQIYQAIQQMLDKFPQGVDTDQYYSGYAPRGKRLRGTRRHPVEQMPSRHPAKILGVTNPSAPWTSPGKSPNC